MIDPIFCKVPSFSAEASLCLTLKQAREQTCGTGPETWLTGVDNHSWQAFQSGKKVKHTRLVILEWHDSQSGQHSTPETTVWDDSRMMPYPGEPAPMTE